MKKVLFLFSTMAILGSSYAQNAPSRMFFSTNNEAKSFASLLENQSINKIAGTSTPAKLNIKPRANANKGTTTTDTLMSHFVGTPSLYRSTNGGYVTGHNGYGDLSKMQRFDAAYGVTATGTINKVIMAFGAKNGSSSSVVTVKIWGDNAGKPGTVLASIDVPYSAIDTTTANGLTEVTFPNPVAIPANKIFYAGISFTYGGTDTVGLVSTEDGDFSAALTHTWEQWDDGTYHSFGDPTNWDLGIALAIFPVVELDEPTPAPQQTVYFSEDFNNGIPSSFAIIDNDGLPVAPAIAAIIPRAWNSLVADGSTDSSAVSTSWYVPSGTSDDWMITSAIIIPDTATAVSLSWDAEAIDPDFRDGYEVYVSNTTQTIAGCQANPTVFTIAGENDVITERKLDLSAYIGDTIYIGFKNNATDMFLLSIDNIKVFAPSAFDLEMNSASVNLIGISEYSAIPARQILSNPSMVNVDITNLGASTPDSAVVYTEIKNGNTVLYSDTLKITSGLPTANQQASFAMGKTFTLPKAAGLYNLTLTTSVSITESEDLSNNSITKILGSYRVTDTTYSRDDNATGNTSLSIGGGLTGHLGMVYDIYNKDTLTSVTAILRGAGVGRKVSISVWDFNGVTPGTTPIFKTKAYNAPTAGTYNFVISGGLEVTAGHYLVTIDELDSSVTIATSTSIFTNNRVWVKSPAIAGGVWNTAESFGANFARAFYIRPNFGGVVLVGLNNTKALAADVNVYPNPSKGQFNVAISSNVVDNYSITVLDMLGRVVNSYTNLPNGEFNIDLSNEANGFYFIKVQSGDSVATQKVVVNK